MTMMNLKIWIPNELYSVQAEVRGALILSEQLATLYYSM